MKRFPDVYRFNLALQDLHNSNSSTYGKNHDYTSLCVKISFSQTDRNFRHSVPAVAQRQRTKLHLAAVSWAGCKSDGNTCQACRPLVQDRERRMVAGDSWTWMVIPDRDRRKGLPDYGNHGREVEAAADRHGVQQRVRR